MINSFFKGLALLVALGSGSAAIGQQIGDELTPDMIDRITGTGSAQTEERPAALINLMTQQTSVGLDQLRDPNSAFYNRNRVFDVPSARASVIRAAARGVGIRGGFAYEAERINRLLMQKYRPRIERTYDFRPLMLQNGFVVPPVITRIQDVAELNGPNFLYLTNGSYEIARQPRLAIQPPTWIDYLILPIRGVAPPDNILLDGVDEEAVWSAAVEDSWETGVREARLTFNTALATLHRDFGGMRLYHNLARQGAVSIPTIDVENIPWRVTEDGQRAFEGEVTIEIKVGPRFRRR